MAERPLSPAESRAAALAAARVSAWGLAIYLAVRVAAAVLDSMSMAALAAQAVIAELGVGRLGVAWSDPLAPMPTSAALARRAATGAVVGLVVAGVATAFLASTGAVLMVRSAPTAAGVGMGLVTAGLLAMRDELLLHGLVMRAMISVNAAVPRVLACGLTSAAATFGEGQPPRAVLAQGLLGVVFGALWARDRGAWQAFGAHTAWLFGSAFLLDGGLYDSHPAANAWGGGAAGWPAGAAFVVSLLPFAAIALVFAARDRHSPPEGAVG